MPSAEPTPDVSCRTLPFSSTVKRFACRTICSAAMVEPSPVTLGAWTMLNSSVMARHDPLRGSMRHSRTRSPFSSVAAAATSVPSGDHVTPLNFWKRMSVVSSCRSPDG